MRIHLRDSRNRSRVVATATAATVLAATALVTPSPATMTAASAKWAWVVVRQATGDIVPGPRDRGNSAGGSNAVTDLSGFFGPGVYGVSLPDVGPASGEQANVLVSALGSKARVCAPHSWTVTNDDVDLLVACFDIAGQPKPSRFVVNWLVASGEGGRLAYGTNHSPTSNCGSPSNAYHSRGLDMETCPRLGLAHLRIPGLGSARGTAQVAALTKRATDASFDPPSAGYCSVAYLGYWSVDDEAVDVACFEPGGEAEIYRRHDVWFMQDLGMKGITRKNVAYLLANKLQRASYRPAEAYRYSSAGLAPKVERLGVGRYRVTLPGMPKGGSAQVTPYASRDAQQKPVPRHCVISAIGKDALPQRVGVSCFDPGGSPADARFLLSYAR